MDIIENRTDNLIEILVVEDSPTQAEQLKYILENYEYRVYVTRNGKEALDFLYDKKPALVISDIIMPEMDGYDFCKQMKSDPQFRYIPILLLTSLSDPVDVIKGLECGADNFITKPYEEKYLTSRIQYLLANRHLYEYEGTRLGVEISFGGKKYYITSDRLQILNLLLSTYEVAVKKNEELIIAQDELKKLNNQLEQIVAERTASLNKEIDEHKKTEEKLRRLNLILSAIRNVNQLIVREKDRNRLLKEACNNLIETRGYTTAWVVLFNDAGGFVTAVEAGIGNKFSGLVEAIRYDKLPYCIRTAMKRKDTVFIITHMVEDCFGCPLQMISDRNIMSSCLNAEDKVYGVLTVTVPKSIKIDEEEKSLFKEVAGDLGFALHSLEMEKSLIDTNLRLKEVIQKLETSNQEISRTERLRALGEMASGIAHDFNNALSPIMGFTELLLQKPQNLDDKEKTIHYLELIHTAAKQAADVVRRLRTFYRKREEGEKFRAVDINQVVEEAISLTSPKWKDQALSNGIVVNIETRFSPIPMVSGNTPEIRDALVNLIFNAVDAIHGSGTITILTHQDGEWVCVEVEDTGSGMTKEVLQRCIEPFFTTKGKKGTGLGLPSVYGTVQRHQGKIDIQSEVGKGTKVIIHLPLWKQSVTIDIPNKESNNQASLSILIVDDDPRVRNIIVEYLRHNGHKVEEAESGHEGLEKFQNRRFDLVITDKGMPEMSGDQMAVLIKKMNPHQPVILLTGFGDIMNWQGEHPSGVDMVLAKPVDMDTLNKAIATLIGHYKER